MIIVKLDGGMGNQLFQYAAGKCLAHQQNMRLKLDISLYTPNNRRQYSLHHFHIKEVFSTMQEEKQLKRKEYIRQKLNRLGLHIKPYWYTEQKPGYDEYFPRLSGNVYLEGFWQSEKYFAPIENEIRKYFIVKGTPSGLNRHCLSEMEYANAISIHVRRGDYVTDQETHAVHGVCDINYYKEAIEHMAAKVSDPVFFVFSDDIEWAKKHISTTPYQVTYVDHNADAAHEDLRLMYSCKHHIIANSSFSWWGAWLNNSKGKKVIAPRKWFQTLTNNDIIPPGWLIL